MRWYVLLLAALLLVPSIYASMDETVNVSIFANGTAQQCVSLSFVSALARDNITFPIGTDPVVIAYNGTYTIDNGTLVLNQSVHPGTNKASFTVYRTNATRGTGQFRTFGSTFSADADTFLSISVTLPPGLVLRDVAPAVSPRPASISSDGRSVVINWKDYGPLDVVVFYEDPSAVAVNATITALRNETANEERMNAQRNPLLLLVAGVFVLCAFALRMFVFSKRKNNAVLMDTLGPDEQAVVEFIRHGFTNQKQIAAQAGFSKSKMSKVVRKLEEKKIVRKEPFFKTNKLKLLARWK